MKEKRKWAIRKRRGGGERRGEEREGPPLSADKRQKWMNPIGRWASSSLLSPRLRELRTHFIEICEIRKAGYRVIYHRATPAHTSSLLHNKSHNWHFFFFFLLGFLTIICCSSYKSSFGFSRLLLSRSNKLGLDLKVPGGFREQLKIIINHLQLSVMTRVHFDQDYFWCIKRTKGFPKWVLAMVLKQCTAKPFTFFSPRSETEKHSFAWKHHVKGRAERKVSEGNKERKTERITGGLWTSVTSSCTLTS